MGNTFQGNPAPIANYDPALPTDTVENNRILGTSGDDLLTDAGGSNPERIGGNTLAGLGGDDTLTGQGGADTFIIDDLLDGVTTILDFEDGFDKIGLAGGLTFDDLTIGSDGGDATIATTASGEVFAVVTRCRRPDRCDRLHQRLMSATSAVSSGLAGAANGPRPHACKPLEASWAVRRCSPLAGTLLIKLSYN